MAWTRAEVRRAFRVKRSLAIGTGVLAAVLAGALFSSRRDLSSSPASRATPGRLFGEHTYRPWQPHRTARFTVAAIGSRGSSASESDSDRAIAQLLAGHSARAIAGFELAAQNPNTAGQALTDLAAAYLLQFEESSDPLDLLRAIQASERALRSDATNDAARFNRAKALSLLGTRTLAERAWKEVFARDNGGWKDEASAQFEDFKRRSIDEQWTEVVRRIDSDRASTAAIEEATKSYPASARAFGEEVLLPRWAQAMESGDVQHAERTLKLASIIAATLKHERGEELLSDALTSIQRTIASGSVSRREALFRGLKNFGAGVTQYNEQNLATAEKPLQSAATDLAAVENPLHLWARFYAAISESYKSNDRGLRILNDLLKAIPEQRYPTLMGRIEWIAATIDNARGRVQSSVRRFEHAAAGLRRGGGDPAAAFVDVLLAEAYTALGEYSLAWQKRKVAFLRVPFSEGHRRNTAMWAEAEEALVRQSHLELAGPLVEEEVAAAERWGQQLGRATAYLDRSAYRIEIGDRDAAFADLAVAKRSIAGIERSGLQEQMTSFALITEGLGFRTVDPHKAVELIQLGLRRRGDSGTRYEIMTYTTAMATEQVRAGDVQGATASLERVLALFEDVRSTVDDPVSRMQAFRQAQPAFDQLIALRTDMGADDEESFRLAERSRARVLLDLLDDNSGGPRHDDFARLDDVEKSLPRGAAFVSYVVLENRVLAWVIEDGRWHRVTLHTDRETLMRQIERYRLEVRHAANVESIRAVAATLYDTLIQPLGLAKSGHSLVIVPDRWLARLPFAALLDRKTGQYLIEQRAIAFAPSATLLLRGSRRRQTAPATSALAIAVSRAGSYGTSSLPALPDAVNEASSVAALYEHASLLRDAQATRENFLRAALYSNVIHFVGHAVVDLDAPRRSVLLFASPASDGLQPLSFGELLDLGIRHTDLVVLSACRTQDSLADDREGLLGLAGAFIAGGVSEAVASPWDVDDRLAPPLMAAFHRHYTACRSASVAFQRAVLDMLRSKNDDVSSPAAWGGFTVITGSMEKVGA